METNSEKTFAQVTVPLFKSTVFSEFHPYWIEFTEQIDGKIVRLIKKSLIVHAPDGILSEECFDGWEVDTLDQKFETLFHLDGRPLSGKPKLLIPRKDFASWLPEGWLTSVGTFQTSLFE